MSHVPTSRAGTEPAQWLFRLRYAIYGILCLLGLTAPWDFALHLDGSGPNAHLWGVLSVALSKAGVLNIAAAFDLLLGLGIACAAAGAALRTWASATGRGGRPRFAGAMLLTLAVALLMPISGAIFVVVSVAALLWGFAALTPPSSHPRVGYLYATIGEIYGWGVASSFAIAGWRYNAELLIRCVLVAAGVAILLRGVLPTPAQLEAPETPQP